MSVTENELVDFDDASDHSNPATPAKQKGEGNGSVVFSSPGLHAPGHSSVHASGFRDFLLKPELLRSIGDCGFEHPSTVQSEGIPQALLGMDLICQARSGMGKSMVFILATLQQIDDPDTNVDTVVITPTRELAYQTCLEFERFTKYMPDIRIAVLFGGYPKKDQVRLIKETNPHIVIGTPGRVLQLAKENHLRLRKVARLILDECDKMFECLDMRADIKKIRKHCPKAVQVMMFSATINQELKAICKRFTKEALEISVKDDSDLRLYGLQQFFLESKPEVKYETLADCLDRIEFNQVVIFVNTIKRAINLDKYLRKAGFPSLVVHSHLKQTTRIDRYNRLKKFSDRVIVCTDVFGRGVDFERINVVINYDIPRDSDTYLHRIARAGRFGTQGMAISLVSSDLDNDFIKDVQTRFNMPITACPEEIDGDSYMGSSPRETGFDCTEVDMAGQCTDFPVQDEEPENNPVRHDPIDQA